MNRLHAALTGCAAVAALAPVSVAQVRFRTVAVSGEQTPGQPPGILIGFFGSPAAATSFNGAPVRIDKQGNIAFSAGLTGPGGSTPAATGAVLKEAAGQLRLVAKHGDPAPGGGTFEMNALFNGAPGVGGGVVAFGASLAGGPTFGMYTDRSGALQRSLFSGDHPRGTPAQATFSQVAFHMAEGGAIIYDASYTDGAIVPRTNEGLWRDSTGRLEAVAVNGMGAPGVGPGVIFTEGTPLAFFGPIDVWNSNDQGRVVFNGYLGGPGITTTNDEGVWAEDAGGLRLVVREGDPAPGAGAGARFMAINGFSTFGGVSEGLSGMEMNNAGDAVFGAFVEVPGADPFASLWARLDGNLTLVARQGLGAPGFPEGFTYLNDFPRVVITGSGRIAFSGEATDPAITTFTSAIWTRDRGETVLLAKEGDPRPGGGVFGPLFLMQYSESGTALFADRADISVYAADAPGHIVRLVAPGDLFTLGETDVRVVRQVGPGLGIGDNGQFGFTLEFADLSEAVVVATPFGAETCLPDFDGDGDERTDADIEAFFACIAGNCCASCGSADFNGDGDAGTDADIESFFRVLAGGPC